LPPKSNIAVRELAIEHGLFTAEDHRRFTEWAESVGPAAGSRLVAKAWTDPAFKARLLEDGTKACKEIGIDCAEPTGFGTPSDYTNFRVLEDTPTLHHVIVCTLCSCYPRPLLGMSPEWYRSTNYRRRLVRWPRQVLAEFGARRRGISPAACAPFDRGLKRLRAAVRLWPRRPNPRKPRVRFCAGGAQ
jgi:thiocyanate hydrolase subunit gamma